MLGLCLGHVTACCQLRPCAGAWIRLASHRCSVLPCCASTSCRALMLGGLAVHLCCTGVYLLVTPPSPPAPLTTQLEKVAGASKKVLQDVVQRCVYTRGCPTITAAFWARRRAQPEIELAVRQQGGEDVRRAAFATRGGLIKVREGGLCHQGAWLAEGAQAASPVPGPSTSCAQCTSSCLMQPCFMPCPAVLQGHSLTGDAGHQHSHLVKCPNCPRPHRATCPPPCTPC